MAVRCPVLAESCARGSPCNGPVAWALTIAGCAIDRRHTDPETDGRVPLDEAEGEAAPITAT
jgi:hypothetical protein